MYTCKKKGHQMHEGNCVTCYQNYVPENPYPRKKGFGLRVARAKKAMIGLGIGNDLRLDKRTGEVWSYAHSRTIDNVFESPDAEAVIWALMNSVYKETLGESLLSKGIKKYLGDESDFKDWQAVYHGYQP